MQFPPSKTFQTSSNSFPYFPILFEHTLPQASRDPNRQSSALRSGEVSSFGTGTPDVSATDVSACQCHFELDRNIRSDKLLSICFRLLRLVWNLSHLGERRGDRRLNPFSGTFSGWFSGWHGDLRGLNDGLPWRSISGLLRQMQQVGERMALNDTCGWAYFKICQSSYIIYHHQI